MAIAWRSLLLVLFTWNVRTDLRHRPVSRSAMAAGESRGANDARSGIAGGSDPRS